MERITLPVKELSSEQKKGYQPFLKKELWQCLEGHDPWGIESAIIYSSAVHINEKPVGLAIVSYRPNMQHAKLLWLYVLPEFRHQQIAKTLLEQIEALLKSHSCEQISYVYQADLPTTPALEALLKNMGWHTSYPFSVRCHFLRTDFNPFWLHYEYKLPKEFSLFPWKELTETERDELKFQVESGQISSSISPFHDEETIDPINSLGMRYKGDVIGWIITNRISQEIIQFSSLYIKRDYHLLGYSIAMLVKSMKQHKNTDVYEAILDINLEESDSKWIQFIRRRLVPNCCRIERFNQSFHVLNPLAITFEDEILE